MMCNQKDTAYHLPDQFSFSISYTFSMIRMFCVYVMSVYVYILNYRVKMINEMLNKMKIKRRKQFIKKEMPNK